MNIKEASSLVSMTGFATKSVELFAVMGEQCVADIEIKTLNSRFFEPTCKLPAALSGCEMEIISRLKSSLVRGRVYCTIRLQGLASVLEKNVFSPIRVQEYLAAAELIKEEFGVAGSLSLAELMQMPQVFSPERAALTDDMIQALLRGLDEAIAGVILTRQREGQALFADIAARLDIMLKSMAFIDERVKELLLEHKAGVAALQHQAQQGDEAAKALLPERLSALDKMDVHEEIVRFASHVNAIEKVLAEKSPEKGRKLDFTMQELMREVNTVTSKCSSYEISSKAVDIKVEIEKIREQVQNIV